LYEFLWARAQSLKIRGYEGSLFVAAHHRATQTLLHRAHVPQVTGMTVVKRMTFVPFSAAQMFDLVNDVAAYPDFLPWCAGSEILQREPTRIRACLRLKKGPLDASFTTDNRLESGRSISLALVDGPFSKLQGCWYFEPADGGSIVRLEMEFEFSGKLLSRVFSAAFKPIADSLVEAFKKRAYVVYGR
jgi:ribosome-associated toxin RatA of RatAB toxin-antitoxin module